MGGRLISALAACAACLLAGPAGAGAQSVADTVCPPPGSGDIVTPGEWQVSQTLSPGRTGKLTAAQIRITKNVGDGPGNYVVSIYNVDIAGTPLSSLASTTIPESAVPAGSVNLPVTAVFTSPAAVFPSSVFPGGSFALVVTRPGSGAGGLRLNFRPNGCPGSLFTSMGGPFTDTGDDLVFTTFVDPAPVVTIKKRPKKATASRRARFAFTANEAGVTFTCGLDGRPRRPCTSPMVYRKLKRGTHGFVVYGTDSAGSGSTAPTAGAGWKVRKPKP